AIRRGTPPPFQCRLTHHGLTAVSAKKRRALTQMLALLGNYLAQRAESRLVAKTGSVSPLANEVESILAAHTPEEHLSLQEVARRVSLSPCHFCRVFKQQTGLTLTEFRLRHQVEQAKKLLEEEPLRVSEVAFAAGFESIPHFNHIFRRYVGCPPTQYRREQRAQIHDKKMQIQE
ncbi:MAG TPA: AraC family transcriptional regulator, partial [Verrucomicrobiae bacterium]